VIRDPFPSVQQHQQQQAALFLGAKCSQCGDGPSLPAPAPGQLISRVFVAGRGRRALMYASDVCQGKQCSMFYAKRFCMTCAAANRQHFPPEIQKARTSQPHTRASRVCCFIYIRVCLHVRPHSRACATQVLGPA
jgi:hypothetical protein